MKKIISSSIPRQTQDFVELEKLDLLPELIGATLTEFPRPPEFFAETLGVEGKDPEGNVALEDPFHQSPYLEVSLHEETLQADAISWLMFEDQSILVAQLPVSSDAGGGLVQQDDDSGSGALGWGDAGLGLLALGALALAAGGGGGSGSSSTEFQDVVLQPNVTNLSGSDIFAKPIQKNGNEYSATNAGGSKLPLFSVDLSDQTSPPTLVTLNLPGSQSPDGDAVIGNAQPGTFEVLTGSYDPTTGVFTYATAGSNGDDLLVLWDGGYPSGRDVGFVLENFSSAGDSNGGVSGIQTTLQIEGYSTTVTTTGTIGSYQIQLSVWVV